MKDELKAATILAGIATSHRWWQRKVGDSWAYFSARIEADTLGGAFAKWVDALDKLDVHAIVYGNRSKAICGNPTYIEIDVPVYLEDVPIGTRIELSNGNHYITDGSEHRCECGEGLEWDGDRCPACAEEGA